MISWSALASIGGLVLQSRNASCQAPCATGGKYRRGGLHGELGHPAGRAYGLEPFRPRGVYRLALAGVKPVRGGGSDASRSYFGKAQAATSANTTLGRERIVSSAGNDESRQV